MGRLVTRQTILVLFFFFYLNLGACAGFPLANCDWLGRTIAFYQVFFQQGRVALIWANDVSVPRKVTSGLPRWNFLVQCPGLFFLAARWSGPAASASIFSVCLDYILRVCQSLWDSFLYLGKLHWFLYLLLFYFYDPGMFIVRWCSNFVEKVVSNESMLAKMASRVSYLVP